MQLIAILVTGMTLDYTNAANDSFKSVATLFGSGTTDRPSPHPGDDQKAPELNKSNQVVQSRCGHAPPGCVQESLSTGTTRAMLPIPATSTGHFVWR
ncbi:MAG: hypothetical protein O3B13_03645 [Planctomycetota bacterium]|nr:hypothetical protein [Planctomycetota bacterium]